MTERPVEISQAEHELFLSLQEQFTDPLRERLETEGRAYAELFNTLPEAVQRKTVLMQELDAQWPYMNKPVTVSGYMLVRDDANDGGFEWHAVRNLPMISTGFDFMRDKFESDDGEVHDLWRAGYLYQIPSWRGGDRPALGWLDFDYVDDMELPFPSPEVRARQFAYHSPEAAAELDEIVGTIQRVDTMIEYLGLFSYKGSLDTEEGAEKLADLEAKLNAMVPIDQEVPYYFVDIVGDIITVNNETAYPGKLLKKHVGTMKFHRICVRLDDIRTTEMNGERVFVPFIEGELFAHDPSKPTHHLIIPCSSFYRVESVRSAL